jgi:hypothetical protein
MQTTVTPLTEAEIWTRIIMPEKNDLSPETARSLLELTFAEGDKTRMNDPARKMSSGFVSPLFASGLSIQNVAVSVSYSPDDQPVELGQGAALERRVLAAHGRVLTHRHEPVDLAFGHGNEHRQMRIVAWFKSWVFQVTVRTVPMPRRWKFFLLSVVGPMAGSGTLVAVKAQYV